MQLITGDITGILRITSLKQEDCAIQGSLVCYFWKPYRKYENVEHAMCCAHLERALVGFLEQYDRLGKKGIDADTLPERAFVTTGTTY